MAGVDRRFAAHGTIDLGQQRRRYLHVVDATQQSARGEAGNITDNATAQCNQAGRPFDAALQ